MAKKDHVLSEEQAEIQALNDQLKATEKSLQNLKQKYSVTESRLQEALDDVQKLEEQNNRFTYLSDNTREPTVITPTESKKKRELELCPVALFGDVHPFERVSPEKVQFTNKYTPNICKRRISVWAKEVVRRINLRIKGGEYINKLTIALMGDLVGNMLRSEDMKSNYGSVNEELLFMTDQLIAAIEYIYKNTDLKEIYIAGLHGNHDRGTPLPEHATLAEESHTWVLYHNVKRIIEEYTKMDNITFDVAQGYFLTFNVFDYLIRGSHGHGFRYDRGVGGPLVPGMRAKRGWDSAEPVYMDVVGHHHSSHTGKHLIINGSVIGYSVFANNKGFDYEPPDQTFMLINPEFGLTGIDHIILDKKYSMKSKKEKAKDNE